MDIPGLNERQRRTLDQLIGEPEDRPAAGAGLAEYLTKVIEARIAGRTVPGGVWISKRLVGDLGKCEGLFAATLLREGPEFEHSEDSAVGSLLHRAVKEDIGVGSAESERAAGAVCDAAVGKLRESDATFRAFWDAADEGTRASVMARATALLERFRDAFPPLRRLRRELQPAAEAPIKVELAGGNVTLKGVVDLAVGKIEKGRASRLLIDHKTGSARPEFAEEMRFYALLLTLRDDVPPYRIATYFVEAADWQAEEVRLPILEHAAERVGRAARLAIDVVDGSADLQLTPGAWCGWCPRSATCPSSAA